MRRALTVLSLAALPVPAASQVLESEVFEALRSMDIEVSFDERIEDGDTVRFENLVFLEPKEGSGVALDWLAESVTGDTTEITVSPEGTLFNRTLGGDTIVARLGLTNVISTITGETGNRDIQLEGDAITATLAAFDDLATGVFSVNGVGIRSSISSAEKVASTTEARVDQVSLALTGSGSEWDTISVRVDDIELMQESDMNAALSEMIKSQSEPEDVNEVLAILDAAFSGQATIGGGSLFVHGKDNNGTPIDVTASFRDYSGRTMLTTKPDVALGVNAMLGEFGASVLSDLAQMEIDAEEYEIALDLSLGADDVQKLAARLEADEEPEPTDFASLDVEARIGVAANEFSGRFDEGDMTGSFEAVSARGSERITFRNGVVDMEIESDGFELRGLLPDISEEELILSSEGLGMRFQIPMIPSADGSPQTLETILAVRELLAGDAIWNLFDPDARIDREPINIDVDVAMTGRLLEPLTDEDQELFDVFDPEAVEIRSYAITAGGAEMRASGETTLDMSRGIPAGEGKIFVTLKGATTLLGHLVDLGIAPPEANMGLLGGLGAFASQVEPDHYESEIEFFPDGKITTNGRPVPLGR